MTLIIELRVTGIDIDAALTAAANWSDVAILEQWNSVARSYSALRLWRNEMLSL